MQENEEEEIYADTRSMQARERACGDGDRFCVCVFAWLAGLGADLFKEEERKTAFLWEWIWATNDGRPRPNTEITFHLYTQKPEQKNKRERDIECAQQIKITQYQGTRYMVARSRHNETTHEKKTHREK